MPTNAEIDTILHAMTGKSKKRLILLSAQSNALVGWAMASKRVEFENGGAKITNPLITGRNPNTGTFEYYGRIPVAQTNEFNTAEFYWSRFAATVIISGQEKDENRGDQEIFKVLKGKMTALEESIQERFSTYVYGSGSGTDPYGLAALIPDDPTTGTIGGLSRVTENQWRTSSYDFSTTPLTSATIEEAMDDILLDLTLRNQKPDLILFGRNLIRIHREAIRDKIAINLSNLSNGARMVDLGFNGSSHANIPVMYDESCPVNKGYFINSKYVRMHVLRHRNMTSSKLTSPWDMDASGSRILWQGNFCNWRPYRTSAVLINGS